jgi:hypothetical protein
MEIRRPAILHATIPAHQTNHAVPNHGFVDMQHVPNPPVLADDHGPSTT